MVIGDLYSGYAEGKLTLESSGRMVAGEILKFHSEIQSMLNEITKKGWRYLYIETKGKAVAEVALENSRYKLTRLPGTYSRETSRTEKSGSYVIEVEIGLKPPEIKDVPEVHEFKVNISTKQFPRAVTIDLSKGVVTYMHDAFWKWEKGLEKDPKKLSEAKEVYEVAKWLLEVKKIRIHESYNSERYKELSELLEELIR